MNIPQEPKALRRYISTLASVIADNSGEPADCLEYKPRPTDLIVQSKEEMLAALTNSKEEGIRVIRTDTGDVYWFLGGDCQNEENYLLLGEIFPIASNNDI